MLQTLETATSLPPGPKKPLNAFMLFSSAKRAGVQEETPGMAAGAISKLLGEMWAGTSAADRLEWIGKANEDKDRYTAALRQYQLEHGALPPSKPAPAVVPQVVHIASSCVDYVSNQLMQPHK